MKGVGTRKCRTMGVFPNMLIFSGWGCCRCRVVRFFVFCPRFRPVFWVLDFFFRLFSSVSNRIKKKTKSLEVACLCLAAFLFSSSRRISSASRSSSSRRSRSSSSSLSFALCSFICCSITFICCRWTNWICSSLTESVSRTNKTTNKTAKLTPM